MEGLEVTFGIVGGLALLVGLGFATWRLSMLLGWKRRSATVVSYLRQRAYRGSSFCKVTVRLTTEEGQAVEATDAGPWNRYGIGQEISVLIVPDSDPLRVVPPEFLRFWMMSLIFIPFGAAFLYVAFVYAPSLG